jgi:ADP-heptose:LPS heptosyltransferase
MLTDEQPGRSLVQACDILDGSGLIDDYIVYPVGSPLVMARLLLQLRSRKFDILVYLIRANVDDRRIQRDKLFFRLAGIKRCIGMQEFCKPPINRPGMPMAAIQHIADALLARFRADGLKTPIAGQGRVDIGIGEREQDNVKRWLWGLPDDGGRRWLAIGPGSKMPCKIWPSERYLAVAKYLVSENDLWPVIFGGPGDRYIGERLLQELGRGYVAAGVLGVRDSMAAMERCLLFLGNDTGTMHMAAACGVRCVAIFSSRDIPGLWYPYGNGHVVLRTQVSCEGCMLEECVERKMKCILSISVQQVIEACRSILAD